MATLLVIEDSAQQRAEIRAAVERSAAFDRILEAEDGLQGLKLLLSEPVDVVLCDLELPGPRRREAAPHAHRRTRRGVRGPLHLPLRGRPTTTGARGSCAAAPRTRSRKPFHPADLVARLELHLKLVRLQRELISKNKLLEQLSTTDPLTGLRNRRYLTEVLSVEFLRAKRYHTPLSVVMADIDHFKAVNDRHGHATGDSVLEAVGGDPEAPAARQRPRRALRRRGVPDGARERRRRGRRHLRRAAAPGGRGDRARRRERRRRST